MVKDIIQIGDKRLLEVSEPINPKDISKGEIQELADNLTDTLLYYNKQAAGLSAVQLGVLKRMFVVKRYDLNDTDEETSATELEVMINPEITIIDNEKIIEWEGCMSISNNKHRLFGPVARPDSVKVKYLDLAGEEQEIEAREFFAHLLQHEMDHLEGVLFLSYISNPKNIWSEEELDRYIEQYKRMPEVV